MLLIFRQDYLSSKGASCFHSSLLFLFLCSLAQQKKFPEQLFVCSSSGSMKQHAALCSSAHKRRLVDHSEIYYTGSWSGLKRLAAPLNVKSAGQTRRRARSHLVRRVLQTSLNRSVQCNKPWCNIISSLGKRFCGLQAKWWRRQRLSKLARRCKWTGTTRFLRYGFRFPEYHRGMKCVRERRPCDSLIYLEELKTDPGLLWSHGV